MDACNVNIDPAALQLRPVSEAWLDERSTYLGATDVSAILGLHPYKSPLRVYQEKKGLVAPPAINQPMVHGQNLEQYVSQCYSRATDRKLRKSHLYRDRKVPYFAANPDYEIRGEKRLLECKTAGYFAGQIFGERSDSVPDQYLIQCLWQLMVTRRDVCDLAVLIGGQDFRIYTVHRDEELISGIRDRALDWWGKYMLADVPPPISDAACDTEYLKSEYPQSTDNIIYADCELDDLCVEHREAKHNLVTATAEEARLQNAIKERMKDAGTLVSSVGSVTWKTNGNGSRCFRTKYQEVSSCQTQRQTA